MRRIILKSGGAISGTVKDSSGASVKNAVVQVQSKTVNINKTIMTDEKGAYRIAGLLQYDQSQNTIRDYIVSVDAVGYQYQSKGLKQVGDIVDFTLSKGTNYEISGTVSDKTSRLVPPGISVLVKIYENQGGYVTKTQVNSDGTFKFTGLNSSKQYNLRFSTQSGTVEWSKDGDGVSGRDDATAYATGTKVDFKFSVEW